MRKFFIFNRQRFPAFLFCLLYISMSFLISGCSGGGGGGDANSSSKLSETASATFTIAWHNAPVIETSENSLITTQAEAVDHELIENIVQDSENGLVTAQAEPVNCDLIENIICEVYDGSNTYLTSEVFACSAGQGTINNIPAGEDRAFVILGEDVDGNILYHGEVSGITITAGETNDLGIIDCYYFVPTLLSPEDNSDVILDKFSLNWTPVETAYEYRVQVSEDFDFNTMVVDETIPDIQYTPLGLSESTTYYWKAFARDIHANQGMESQEVWRFNVIPEEECTYSISPTSRSVASGGGAGSISVTSSASGCTWTASESVDWIEITSGSSGSGNGTVTYTVSENTTDEERTAIITVAGQTHTVTQEAPVPGECTYSISPPSLSFTSSGGPGSISVTSSETTCSWTATESASWINITSGSSGSGNGMVTYTVSSNTTGSSRTSIITVAGQTHTVTQGVPVECTYSISPPSHSFTSSGGTGSISVTPSTSTCSWTASEGVAWINITSGSSGSGNGTVTYTVSSNTTGSSRTAIITVAGQTHTVTQSPITVISVTITGPTQVNESSGAPYTLTALWSDDSSTIVTSSASWSENSGYATISSGGYLTTYAVTSDQRCTITASYGGRSDTHNVTIKNVPIVSSVTITGLTQVNESSGAQYTLTALWDNDTSTTVTSSASWSENSGYATISSGGYLTTYAVTSDQRCTITASYGGKSDIHSVTIKDVPPDYVIITGPTQVNDGLGEQYTLWAYYSNPIVPVPIGINVTNSASWSENSGYATISSSGYLTTYPVPSDQLVTITASYGGRSDTHSVTIRDVPVVTVTATDPTAREAEEFPNTGTYRISRTGSTSSNLTVYFTMSGIATNGSDYKAISSPITIAAGSSYRDITLTPINNYVSEANETAILELLTNSAYYLAFPYSATITISDDDGGSIL